VKFVIVGAGATGAFLGARLARAGVDVTLVARGAHLAAMRERGVEVRSDGESFVAHPPCTDDLSIVVGADAVILTLKAHSLPEIAPRLGPLLGPKTAIVMAVRSTALASGRSIPVG
jgi:2-dehydropantoate 2-reductase